MTVRRGSFKNLIGFSLIQGLIAMLVQLRGEKFLIMITLYLKAGENIVSFPEYTEDYLPSPLMNITIKQRISYARLNFPGSYHKSCHVRHRL